jgi:hypothetical protein
VAGSLYDSPPALAAAKDIYRSDLVAATKQGAKLASYEESGAATRYTNTYLPNGRLSTSKAAPTGKVGSLTQDWLETFLFNGIGNIDRVEGQRNAASGNSRPDRYETERYRRSRRRRGRPRREVPPWASECLTPMPTIDDWW